MSSEDQAARTCAFIIERAQPVAGRRWIQEKRPATLTCASQRAEVRLFADYRLFRIGEDVARALVSWADGLRDVALLERVPAPREVLHWQARGRRCVSLVGPEAPLGRHADPLAFAIHDLCHLEKFATPEHHDGQVGFFRLVERAMSSAAWPVFEGDFDALWQSERDYVIADMNGSALFLFAALKMKLRMAVRRRLARKDGRPPADTGPLEPYEEAAFRAALEDLLSLFEWSGAVAEAARQVSTRRDSPADALILLRAFEEEGRQRGPSAQSQS